MEKYITVLSVELYETDDFIDVYDIEVEIDHSFIVGGLIAHNCSKCASLSNKQWTVDKKPIGHAVAFRLPPIHVRDRCGLVANTKTFDDLGSDSPEPKFGTRASDAGQIPMNTTFDDYLKTKTKSEQDDRFGVGRMDLWRAGKITLSDLTDNNLRPLTLKQLQDKYDK